MVEYKTIEIGNQLWMAENLDVRHFRNGDQIIHAKTNEQWKIPADEGNPVWCYYDNEPENGKKYGKLYNWYAVDDPRGLAPQGWHVPSDEEWTQLEEYLGESHAARKMKSTNGWNENGNGSNESGFNAIPGGYRYYYGCLYIGLYSIWWSSTEHLAISAWDRYLSYDKSNVSRGYIYRGKGLAVRCLMD